ncbi:MAG: helix-turn-helix domain-containing protein [Pseudomonadota bacterium]
MIDAETDKGRIIEAAMQLAAEQPWQSVSLRDIAEKAELGFDVLRKSFGSKTQIIAGFVRAVDDEVLSSVPERDEGQPARDTLFEVLMARFDLMLPYKEALRSISRDTTLDSTLFGAVLNSQRWMLLAAGLDGDGPRGVLRSAGLATLSRSVFQVWLEDDDPGMAKTMAALDRRLRRAGETMSTIDSAVDGLSRMREMVFGGLKRATTDFRRSRTGTSDTFTDTGEPDVGGAGTFGGAPNDRGPQPGSAV